MATPQDAAAAATAALAAQNAALIARIEALEKKAAQQSAAMAGVGACLAYAGPPDKVPGEPGVAWCEYHAGHPENERKAEHKFGRPLGPGIVVTEA